MFPLHYHGIAFPLAVALSASLCLILDRSASLRHVQHSTLGLQRPVLRPHSSHIREGKVSFAPTTTPDGTDGTFTGGIAATRTGTGAAGLEIIAELEW